MVEAVLCEEAGTVCILSCKKKVLNLELGDLSVFQPSGVVEVSTLSGYFGMLLDTCKVVRMEFTSMPNRTTPKSYDFNV